MWPQANESCLRCHKQLEQLLPWGSQREHDFSPLASRTVREGCVFFRVFFFLKSFIYLFVYLFIGCTVRYLRS